MVIVGGASSAGQAALHLAEYTCSVTMIVRAASLHAGTSRYFTDRIAAHPRIAVGTGGAWPRPAARSATDMGAGASVM